MDTNKTIAATFAQLNKLYGTLTAEDAEAVAAGTAKLAVIRSGQVVVETSPIIDLALKAARATKPEDLARAASGGSSFKLAHKGGKVVYPVNVPEIAEQIAAIGSEDAIAKILSADDRLKAAELKKIGAELGILTPSAIKKPEDIIAHIARSLVAFGS